MSIVARRFAATPERLPSATWNAITALVCGAEQKPKAEFQKVAGLASSVIADRSMENHPLVIVNDGPRLRVYCLYGDKAISEDDRSEAPLSWNPTAGKWHGYLPCGPEDFDEYATLVKGQSSSFTVYNIEEGFERDEGEAEKGAAATGGITVDWEAFNKK